MSELVNKLNEIGDAIRTKKNTTEKIPLTDFPSEILSIEGGSTAVLIDKTITENGKYAAADDNADGYATVSVEVPSSGGGAGNIDAIHPDDWMYLPQMSEIEAGSYDFYFLVNLYPNAHNFIKVYIDTNYYSNIQCSCGTYDNEGNFTEVESFVKTSSDMYIEHDFNYASYTHLLKDNETKQVCVKCQFIARPTDYISTFYNPDFNETCAIVEIRGKTESIMYLYFANGGNEVTCPYRELQYVTIYCERNVIASDFDVNSLQKIKEVNLYGSGTTGISIFDSNFGGKNSGLEKLKLYVNYFSETSGYYPLEHMRYLRELKLMANGMVDGDSLTLFYSNNKLFSLNSVTIECNAQNLKYQRIYFGDTSIGYKGAKKLLETMPAASTTTTMVLTNTPASKYASGTEIDELYDLASSKNITLTI